MKSAEELFNEFCTLTDDRLVCYEDNVKALLSEHDKETISKIDGWIKYYQATEDKVDETGNKVLTAYYNGCKSALTELKKQLEGK